jgi:hypothetical protein
MNETVNTFREIISFIFMITFMNYPLSMNHFLHHQLGNGINCGRYQEQ